MGNYGDHSYDHDHGPAGYWDGREDEQREYERGREACKARHAERREELAEMGLIPGRGATRPLAAGMVWDEQGECWVLGSLAGLAGWEVMRVQPWKAGVVRLHIRSLSGGDPPGEFRLVFAREIPG